MADDSTGAVLDFGGDASGRKGQILSAALDVFAEKGYEGGSMREIAAHVGVSEAALYRHFTGKEAIFLALVEAFGVAVRREAIPKVQAMRADTIGSDLRGLLLDRRRTVRRLEPALRVILPVVIRNRAWVAEMKQRVAEPALVPIMAKITELDSELGVEDADASRAGRFRALMSLIAGYLASTLVVPEEQDNAIIEAVLRVMHWDEAGTHSS
jgi:AcrR family transcriptional regulator